jgi:hypothetical protein
MMKELSLLFPLSGRMLVKAACSTQGNAFTWRSASA